MGDDPNALPALDGTPYDWVRPGHYHSIISGDGRVHRLHDYNVDLPAHTYGRNRNSVALSCACMGGVPDPWTQPPTAMVVGCTTTTDR